jgi:hypothetical protein
MLWPDGTSSPMLRPCRDGKRFIVRADDKLTAFPELEFAIRTQSKFFAI